MGRLSKQCVVRMKGAKESSIQSPGPESLGGERLSEPQSPDMEGRESWPL